MFLYWLGWVEVDEVLCVFVDVFFIVRESSVIIYGIIYLGCLCLNYLYINIKCFWKCEIIYKWLNS